MNKNKDFNDEEITTAAENVRKRLKRESDYDEAMRRKRAKEKYSGGNKLKKYTRLGRAQINKDDKMTSRVIYLSGKGH